MPYYNNPVPENSDDFRRFLDNELRNISDESVAVESSVNTRANKNYIINPSFLINQRSFAGGALANNIYGYDRWKASGASSMTASGGVLTIASGIAVQVIEDFGYTGNVTLSWVGTALESGADVSPLTFNMTAGNTPINFSAGTLSQVKLELGNNATPFEYPDVGSDLAKCQRYYFTFDQSIQIGSYNDDDTSRLSSITYPSTMRGIPTLTGTASSGTLLFITVGTSTCRIQITSVATSASVTVSNLTLDAEL